MTAPVVVVLSGRGAVVGRRIATALGVPLWGLAWRGVPADHTFADFAEYVGLVRAEGRALVAVCASATMFEAVRGGFQDGAVPIVTVSHDGGVVTTLFGIADALEGHIARALPDGLSPEPGGDPSLWLDDPPEGWTLGTPALGAQVMARLRAGGLSRIDGDEAIRADWLASLPAASPTDEGLRDVVGIEATTMPPVDGVLTYHPQRLALGVVCAASCPAMALQAGVMRMLEDSETAPGAVKAIFTDAASGRAPALAALADRLRLPVRVVAAGDLDAVSGRLEASPESSDPAARRAGIGEAAALSGAGQAAVLGLPTVITDEYACALAVAPHVIRGLGGRPA